MAYGLWGLGGCAFLAATLIPLSSELAVVVALQLGLPAMDVLVWASVGNCLGAMTNYWLGLLCTDRVRQRLQYSRWGRQAWRWAEHYGGWSLLASCLPWIGDPMMLVSGILRFHLGYVLLLGLGTRVGRYVCLVGMLSR